MSGQSPTSRPPGNPAQRTVPGGGDPPVDEPPGKEGHQGVGSNQDTPVPSYIPGTNPPGTNPPIPTPNAANHPVPGSVPGVVPSDDPQNPYPEGVYPEDTAAADRKRAEDLAKAEADKKKHDENDRKK